MYARTRHPLLLLKPQLSLRAPLLARTRAQHVQVSPILLHGTFSKKHSTKLPLHSVPLTTGTNYTSFPTSSPFDPQIRSKMSSASTATPEQLAELKKYTSCDISDALLRLKVPNSGFIADLHLFPSSTPLASPPSFDSVTVAPASTFLFIPKTLDAQDKSHGLPEGNIPSDSYWVDETQPGTIVVMSQPKGQINAVLGGIMAFRMKVRGAKGVVVSGRVRDMGELAQTEMPIWARATSTVGTGFGSVAHAMGIPLDIDGTIVKPGDIVFSDAREGVVVIPQEKLEEVLQLLPRLVKADDAVIESVKNGMPVKEAFAKYRG